MRRRSHRPARAHTSQAHAAPFPPLVGDEGPSPHFPHFLVHAGASSRCHSVRPAVLRCLAAAAATIAVTTIDVATTRTIIIAAANDVVVEANAIALNTSSC